MKRGTKHNNREKGIWVPNDDTIHVRLFQSAEGSSVKMATVVVEYELKGRQWLEPTGLAIDPAQWDKAMESPKKKHPNRSAVIKTIKASINRVQKGIRSALSEEKQELDEDKPFLNTADKDREGYCPVLIVKQTGDRRLYMDTRIRVREEDWDYSEELPCVEAPYGAFLRKELQRHMHKVNEIRQCGNLQKRSWSHPDLCVFPYQGKPLSDGRLPVYVMIAEKKGIGSFYATGVYLSLEQWDEELPVNEKGIPMWVGPYVRHLIDDMKKQESYGNASVYVTALHILEEVLGPLDFRFSALDINGLYKIERRLRERGVRDTSLSNRFRTIRAIWNRAIKDKVARAEDYPFDQFQMSRFDVSTAHRAVTKDDVFSIINYVVQPDDPPLTELARDLFTFSYLCGGVPFNDLCQLKESNIQQGILTYTRQKTHLPVRVAVPDEAWGIIQKYRAVSKGYMFPILDEQKHQTTLQIRNRVHLMTRKINEALRLLGEKLKLPITLTTYVARHSFATVLKREGVATSTISELMGHQKAETTKIYLDGFSADQLAEAQELLLDTRG